MDSQTFSNISKIIERDSKFTTYKFALLRGVIDIIQENCSSLFKNSPPTLKPSSDATNV